MTKTFSSRLVGGFAITVALTVLVGLASIAALITVTDTKDEVIASANRLLTDSQQLSTTAETRIGDYRAYLLTGADDYLEAFNRGRNAFLDQADELRGLISAPATAALLDQVRRMEVSFTAALTPSIQRRQTITDLRDTSQLNAAQVGPAREALQNAIADLIAQVRVDLDQARQASSRGASQAIGVVCVLCGLTIAAAAVIALRLSRGLRREVGAAVGHIRSSSAQLEAAANQQATGGRDQSSAMNEITTTISELLITSRQIAGNAQQVSEIANDTAEAARSGDATIDQTRQSIAAIRQQVEQIVRHMKALDERSQQIGGVAELVAELAEQTNILAINATIEASGAGEWGQRFAVVADEIRKLADRTADSAKEIRTLIEDVRGAVSTTVRATQAGAEAVDDGVRQFDDATSSFRRIAQLVSTASEATQEIKLSTNQQTTAVEQVSVAASDTSRVTRETEASAIQTRQTAAHLSTLSSDLQKLVGVS